MKDQKAVAAMGSQHLTKELMFLREEVAKIVKQPVAATSEGMSGDMELQLQEIAKLAQEILEGAGKEIDKHPAVAVAGALVLGIAIGRFIR